MFGPVANKRSLGAGPDEVRTARLLLSGLSAGPEALRLPQVRRAARPRPVPGRVGRLSQRLRLRLGRLSYERDWVVPAMEARRAASPGHAEGPPKVLLRVDEFPHARALDDARYGRESFLRFHNVLADAGVPYLLAVVPHPSHDYLDPRARGGRPLTDEELGLLTRLTSECVALALHGRTHRTRDARPARHSELAGLPAAELEELLGAALAPLSDAGLAPPVFVPPFNRFDAAHWDTLARRFDVVCGGPESVALVGWHGTPVWRGDAVYLPSYAPLYGRARDVRFGLERMAAQGAALWAPVTLHVGWELDDGLDELRRLAAAAAGWARPWEEFLGAIRESTAAAGVRPGR